jgi:hypothetical protein
VGKAVASPPPLDISVRFLASYLDALAKKTFVLWCVSEIHVVHSSNVASISFCSLFLAAVTTHLNTCVSERKNSVDRIRTLSMRLYSFMLSLFGKKKTAFRDGLFADRTFVCF